MICRSCGQEIDDGRRFCNRCGADQDPAPATFVRSGSNDDVVTVELARIPTEIRAPTTWSIAKGVFLGLLLWTVAAVVVAALFFAVLVVAGGRAAETELKRVSPNVTGDKTTLTDQDCKDLYLPDDQSGYEECIANN